MTEHIFYDKEKTIKDKILPVKNKFIIKQFLILFLNHDYTEEDEKMNEKMNEKCFYSSSSV